jgi:hypothetical protein
MAFGKKRKRQLAYVQPYDSVHRPPLAQEAATNALRLEQARDSYVFNYRLDVVRAYSTFADPVPNPTVVAMMGLADQARAIEHVTSHKDQLPFPGVRIGPFPTLHRSPDTVPMLGNPAAYAYTANQWG